MAKSKINLHEYGIEARNVFCKKFIIIRHKSRLQIIHIDPSIDIHSTPNLDEVLERIYELYEFCWKS